MKTVEKNTFSLMFYIKKQKLLKNGEAPICLRITTNKQYAEIMIKRSIPIELWSQPKECSKGKDYSDRELNRYLEVVRTKIYTIRRELEEESRVASAPNIRDRYNGKDGSAKTLVEIFENHNQECRKLIGVDFTESTVDKFDTSLNHLKECLKYVLKREDIPLSEITPKFIKDFEVYLKTLKNCKHNSTIKHLKNLKKIIRIALANDWMKKAPFYNIKFCYEDSEISFLTREELDALMKKDFKIERLSQVRDVFVFCCFTGLAFIDVKQLSEEHILKDNNGNLWINKNRQKTGVNCNIPLLPIPLEIIKKYKGNYDCLKNNVLLPVLSNQKMNGYLKEIGELCGITKKLSTHVARHRDYPFFLKTNHLQECFFQQVTI